MEHETIDIAPENEETKLVPITALLEMAASRLGVVVCGWAAAVMVQGGIVSMLQKKDRVFVTVMFLLVCFRYWGNFCPQATDGSLTEASRSLSANNRQQLTVPIRFISRLFYWFKLVSAITSIVLSIMQLASHDFGQTEVANKANRDFALNVFYGLALAEALVLLFALTFGTIMAMQRTVIKALFEWAKPSEPAPAPLSQPAPQMNIASLVNLEAAQRFNRESQLWLDNVGVSRDSLAPAPALWMPMRRQICKEPLLPPHTPQKPYGGSESDVRPSLPIWESGDLAWMESDNIFLRHPHSDFDIAPANEQTIAPENKQTKLVPITALLEMAANRLGVVVCWWAAVVLVQGGIVFMLQTKDRMFVTVMFLLVCFRYWGNFCPQAIDGSLTVASRSLSANNRQQLAVPIRFISRLFYWCKLVSAMTSVVLSIMRLASHDFGQTEVPNKATRDFTLKAFYVVALVEALVLVFALTFVTIINMQRTVTEELFERAKPSKPAPAKLSEPAPESWLEPAAAWRSEPAPAPRRLHAASRRLADWGSEPDWGPEPDWGSEPDVRPSPPIIKRS